MSAETGSIGRAARIFEKIGNLTGYTSGGSSAARHSRHDEQFFRREGSNRQA